MKNAMLFPLVFFFVIFFQCSTSFLIQRSLDIAVEGLKTNSFKNRKITFQNNILAEPFQRIVLKMNEAVGNESDIVMNEREGPVNSCRNKIKEALSPEELIVTSAHDDPNGSHIAVKVVSAVFEGKNRVQRQQLVYKAIWEEMQGPIHAVDQLICKTPEENISSPQNLGEY